MSYTPTIWQNDDLITAGKLNKIEDEIANQYIGKYVFVNEYPTWNEVKRLIDRGIIPILVEVHDEHSVLTGKGLTKLIPDNFDLQMDYVIQYATSSINEYAYFTLFDQEFHAASPNATPMLQNSGGVVIANIETKGESQ